MGPRPDNKLITFQYDDYSLKRNAKMQQTALQFSYNYFSKKLSLDISCESSARQSSHEISSLIVCGKKNKIFHNVVYCSRDWHFTG